MIETNDVSGLLLEVYNLIMLVLQLNLFSCVQMGESSVIIDRYAKQGDFDKIHSGA